MIISKKRIIASAMALAIMAGTFGSVGGQAIVGSAETETRGISAHQSTISSSQGKVGLSSIQVKDVTGFKQSKSSDSSITLKWNKIVNADGYVIKMYDPYTKKWKSATIKDENTTKYTFNTLKENTVYKFVIRGYRNHAVISAAKKDLYSSKKAAQTVGMTSFKSSKANISQNKKTTTMNIIIPKAKDDVPSVTSYKVKITPINSKGKLVANKVASINITKKSMKASGKNLQKSVDVTKYQLSKYTKAQVTITPVVSFNLSASSTRNAAKGSVNANSNTIKNVSVLAWNVLDR